MIFTSEAAFDIALIDMPLTDTEMQKIVEQTGDLKTPLKLNGFIVAEIGRLPNIPV